MPEGNQLMGGISPILTDLALSYIPDASQYIARQVFPNVPVGTPTGKFNIWTLDDFLRIEAKALGNREAPPEIDFTTEQGAYSTQKFGVSANWADQELAEARATGIAAQDLINGKVSLVTLNGVLALEKSTASLCQSNTWTGQYAGQAANPQGASQFLQWDQVGSDPVQDVTNWKRAIKTLTGFMPNKLVLPGIVWDKLKLSPSLIERIKYTGTPGAPSMVTLQMLKTLFEVDDILVPEGVYNAANKGQPKNIQYFWGKGLWLGYVAPAPSKTTPSAGYHFSWTGNTGQGLPAGVDLGGGGPQQYDAAQNSEGLFIRRYDTPRPALHWIDSELWTTPNVTAPDLGAYIQTVIS